jgi:transglutaminase-like putative cysteine protease
MFLVGPLEAADANLFIGQIRVEDARPAGEEAQVLHYRIMHENPVILQEQLARWVDQSEPVEGGVAFNLDAYPVAAAPAGDERHRAASFLIDYTEPIVQALADPIEQRYGRQPTPEELEQFVHDYIVDKNVGHGFDVASMVARSRAGDCTEHAVLLTALLRMYGYPARAVTGLYVSLEEPVLAYGHAWTEYYGEYGWTGLDGTQFSHTVGAQHVPLGVVEDESVAYALGLLGALQALAIDRVIVK